MKKQVFNQHIRNFEFIQLFNELGWNYLNENKSLKFEEENFDFHSIAHKEGFRIIVCQSKDSGKIPSYALRRKIQSDISKLYHENLLIFTDKNKTEQTWQLIDRKPNKPNQFRQTNWKSHQDPELLYQRMKGAFFTLSEEEGLTIVDVTQRLKQNFTANAEKVTKQFYDKFKNEHKRFLGFIEGIEAMGDREWYASLMLNRLMFCYFIQRKGFLNEDINYLRNKLKETRDKNGKDQFYSFYKIFLLNLFHKGLGKPHGDRDIPELGRVPYLNGGLFDVHELEKKYAEIQVKDEAFEKIFSFFDEYNWHLDESPAATGRDINPDVIGYIFEKYINDRAQMGAYYTREDITDYISKNCIIPYLFDEVKRTDPAAMKQEAESWQMLRNSGDKYIYGAVKYGIPQQGDLMSDLPPEVHVGFNEKLAREPVTESTSLHLYELRKEWNKPAPPDIALPTEIYRELIERRIRYQEVKEKINQGEIREINDFITYNLDIKQFAQDVLETTTNPGLVHSFYKVLKKVTILDPTCGSGAFLFAAMNILETLYRKCIDRMESFVAEDGKGKHPAFVKELEQVNRPEHPNLDYFIYKSIILNNLYGVDLMNEAVEIAKLRLFLKLMATVDPDYNKENLGLEPLPDVDFNIRCGNTLVGFATGDELKKGLDYTFDGAIVRPMIEEKCEIVAKAFHQYKEIQLNQGDDYEGFKQAKEDLKIRLNELNRELNVLLHMQYSGTKYKDWLSSYQPFHWFAEYYEIIEENKGFDVIIGNPPYVVYTKKDRFTKVSVSDIYKIKNFKTLACNNLYAFVLERNSTLTNNNGITGMIVPIASISTDGMKELQSLYKEKYQMQWHSNYATRPGKLFSGVDMNLTITILIKSKEELQHITEYVRWYDGEAKNRDYIFDLLRFIKIPKYKYQKNIYPKISRQIENMILGKMISHQRTLNNFYSNAGRDIFYHSGGRYWRKALNSSFSSHYKQITLAKNDSYIALCILNSQLFYWYWISNSNCMDVVSREVDKLPVFDFIKINANDFSFLSSKLLNSYFENAENRLRQGEIISTVEMNFDVGRSKPIIDQIDQILAVHYGFTEEELDFIINYDIKYRMGIGSGAEVMDD